MTEREEENLFEKETMEEEWEWEGEEAQEGQYEYEYKPFYKKRKTYAIGLAIVALATGTGLGIYYGLNNHSGSTTTPGISDEQMVGKISEQSYAKTIITGTKIKQLKEQVDATFIKAKLSDEIRDQFNDNLFTINDFTDSIGRILVDSDLTKITTINGQINYNYDSITHKTVKFKIEVILTGEDIVNEINNQTYQISANLGDEVNSITNQINGEFIRKALNDEIAEAFDYKSFHFRKITVNGEDLSKDHLTSSKEIVAKIVYTYDDISGNQETTLRINVTVSHKQIADAINEVTSYEITDQSNVTKEKIMDKITPEFIKAKLSQGIADAFEINSFHPIKIIIQGRELKDSDLEIHGSIEAEIIYDYGSVNKQATRLTINLTLGDLEVAKAINQANYEIETEVNTKVVDIVGTIKTEFIKAKLTSEIKEAFDNSKFDFGRITYNGKALENNDLKDARVLNAKIDYDYGDISNQETNLTINVTGIGDQEIVDAINNVRYDISTLTDTTADSIKNQINGDFIKTKLSAEIAKAFTGKFSVNQITYNGKTLDDSDLTKEKTLETKINYDYDSKQNQETSLTITVIKKGVSDEDITNEIAKQVYTISIPTDSSVTRVTEQIDGRFIKAKLNSEIKEAFDNNKFAFNKVMVGFKELDRDDLTTEKMLETKINYDYDSKQNQEVNLIINVIKETFTDEEIANEIAKQTYTVSVVRATGIYTLEQQINGDLIKAKLSDKIAKVFDDTKFALKSVTVDNREISRDDLRTVGTIDTRLSYSYGSEHSETDLKVNVLMEKQDEKTIVDTIFQIREGWRIDVKAGTKVSDLYENVLNSSFIINTFRREGIPEYIIQSFDANKFKFNKLCLPGDQKSIEDSDLLQPLENPLVWFYYNYGDYKYNDVYMWLNVIP